MVETRTQRESWDSRSEDTADLIKKYEEILRTKRKGIISVAYHQGKMLCRFRERERFVRLVADFGVHDKALQKGR